MSFAERIRASKNRPNGKVARLWALFIELAKFGAVGGIAYVIDVGTYNLLVFGPGALMGGVPVRAKFVSALVATVFSWLANRYWTFSDKRTDNPTKEFIQFAVINVIGIGIAMGCLYFSRYVLDYHTLLADNISGNVIGTVLGTIFRYLAYKFFVFKTVAKPVADGAEPDPARPEPPAHP